MPILKSNGMTISQASAMQQADIVFRKDTKKFLKGTPADTYAVYAEDDMYVYGKKLAAAIQPQAAQVDPPAADTTDKLSETGENTEANKEPAKEEPVKKNGKGSKTTKESSE